MVYVDKKKVESNIPVTSANEIQVFTKHGEKTPMPQSSVLIFLLYFRNYGFTISRWDLFALMMIPKEDQLFMII